MDRKDFQLLVALDGDARQSLQALARRIALSAPAVRERLLRLEKLGIVQGYWVSIDPAIFGRKKHVQPSAAKKKPLEARDVAWVAWKVDGGITVQLWPREVKSAVTALSRFLGREPSWQGVSRPGWAGRLSGLDWRVLDALIDEPRAPVARLAVATGLSPKTVRRRLQGLMRDEAIFVVPRLGFLTDAGELVYHLLVSGSTPFPDLRRVLGDAVLIHETSDPPRRYLFCRADSLGDMTARTHALEQVPGVSSVQVTLNREMLLGTTFVHALVREQMSPAIGGRVGGGNPRPGQE